MSGQAEAPSPGGAAQGRARSVRVHVDVMLKPEILDPEGQAIQRALPQLGFSEVEDVRVGKHIELDVADDGDLEGKVDALCRKLLANPVIETYRWRVAGRDTDQPAT